MSEQAVWRPSPRLRTVIGLAAIAVFVLSFVASKEQPSGNRFDGDRTEAAAPATAPVPGNRPARTEPASASPAAGTARSIEQTAPRSPVRSVTAIDRLLTSSANVAAARFEVTVADGAAVPDAASPSSTPSTATASTADEGGDPEETTAAATPIVPVAPISDADGDGWSDDADNCPAVANPGQVDDDRDGTGDRCQIGRGLDPLSVELARVGDSVILTWDPTDSPDTDHHVVAVWPPADSVSAATAAAPTTATASATASADGPAKTKHVVVDPRIELPADQVGWVEIETIAGNGRWTSSSRLRLPDRPLAEADVPVIDFCPPGSGDSLAGPDAGPTCKPRLPDVPTLGPDGEDENPGSSCGQIDVEFERGEVRNQPGWERTTATVVDIDCGAGAATTSVGGSRTYDIVLVSRDPDHRPGYQTDQTDERWYLEGLDADGRVVYRSPTTPDLADGLTSLRHPADQADLTGVVAVRAVHHGADSGPNSVEVSAVLVPS